VCAADNAAHMVQGRLRIGTADAKTTAVQRHPFFLLIFFLLRNTSSLRLGDAMRNKVAIDTKVKCTQIKTWTKLSYS